MPSGTVERKRYAAGMRSTGVVRSGVVRSAVVVGAVLASVGLGACSRAEPHEPARPDPDAVRAASQAPAPAPSAPVEAKAKAPPAPRELTAEFARLGAPCGDDAKRAPGRGPFFASEECGARGKVAKVTVPGFHADALPGPLVHREGPPQMMAHALGVEEGRVWAQSSCMACRMMTDSTTVVDLAEASDATLETFQAYVGLPKAPLLRSAAAWREAIPTWTKGVVAAAVPSKPAS